MAQKSGHYGRYCILLLLYHSRSFVNCWCLHAGFMKPSTCYDSTGGIPTFNNGLGLLKFPLLPTFPTSKGPVFDGSESFGEAVQSAPAINCHWCLHAR